MKGDGVGDLAGIRQAKTPPPVPPQSKSQRAAKNFACFDILMYSLM